MPHFRAGRPAWFILCLIALALLFPAAVRADTDDASVTLNPGSVGMQPLRGTIPSPTPAPGESAVKARDDGSYEAIPATSGRTKTFHLVERQAPWTLKPGLTVMATTYNGVVPGPAIIVDQGDTVVIDYRNDGPLPDTIHLHGIHDIPVSMDGVAGISQELVPVGGRYTYRFTATTPGTFMYHTHGGSAVLDSGLYGAIVVRPAQPRPEEQRVAHDYIQMLTAWKIQSLAENHWTINGKEYPATRALDVKRGERIRIRWISLTGEETHTMHTHGHYQELIARDAQPTHVNDLQDTVALAPGQRVDVIVTADQAPGTWLIHCHVMSHIESAGMAAGLISALHYVGTPNTLSAMGPAMMGSMVMPAQRKPLDFGTTLLLGAIAGLTIFIGLPVARMRKLKPATVVLLNAAAIGILIYLVIEIARNAIFPITAGIAFWNAGKAAFPVDLIVVFVIGLLLGLVGLGSLATTITSRAAHAAEHPLVMSSVIAVGIGAHNFGEGLAIGASAASGATAVAIGLIVGFALHNATEGFGIAAPMAGRYIPSWGQLGLAGVIAGGPTFIGTAIGYSFTSPTLTVLFLAIAIGALIFVIGELWTILRRTALGAGATTTMAVGFLVAFATEIFLDLQGR